MALCFFCFLFGAFSQNFLSQNSCYVQYSTRSTIVGVLLIWWISWCAEKAYDGDEEGRLERPSAYDSVFSRATADTHLSGVFCLVLSRVFLASEKGCFQRFRVKPPASIVLETGNCYYHKECGRSERSSVITTVNLSPSIPDYHIRESINS